MTEKTMYLFLFKMGDTGPAPRDILEDIPFILKTIRSVSNEKFVFLLHSYDNETLSYLFVSDFNAHKIKARLESCEGIYSEDHFIILEVGADISAAGLGRATTFLQHNLPD